MDIILVVQIVWLNDGLVKGVIGPEGDVAPGLGPVQNGVHGVALPKRIPAKVGLVKLEDTKNKS